MPTKKTTRTATPSRGSTGRRTTADRSPSDVIYMHEHLAARGEGASSRCQRLRRLVYAAQTAGGHIDRQRLDRAMLLELALPA